MLDLDEVISKVERVELPAHTRQRHLARLHALQAAPADRSSIETETHATPGGRRSRAVLAGGLAAAAVAVVAGASALLVPAHQGPTAPASPGAGSTTVLSSSQSPADLATAPVATTGSEAPELSDAAFSKQLAAVLGVTDAQATAITAQLNTLGRHGGTDRTSAKFNQIAAGAGVKPAQLADAIDQIKKAQLATTGLAGAPAKSTAQKSAQDLLTTDRSVDLFASAFGLNRQKAAELAKKLAALAHGDGLDPRSSGFKSIAQEFGLTPDQLAGGIDAIKKAGK